MRFNETLARLMEDEVRGAVVESIQESGHLGGGWNITLRLKDGRKAWVRGAEYYAPNPEAKEAATE